MQREFANDEVAPFRLDQDCHASRCSTMIQFKEYKHVWEISQFSIHQEICSPGDFVMGTPFGDDEHEFVLKMFPTGKDEECAGFLSVFLQIIKCPHVKLLFRVNFVIHTLDGPRGCALNKSVVTINRGGIVTASKFFPLEQLRSRHLRMTPDDKLTIQCELIVYGEYQSLDFDVDETGQSQDISVASTSRLSLAPNDRRRPLPSSDAGGEMNFGALLESGEFADFELEVEDGHIFRLHRTVLVTRSKYFKVMLQPGRKEFMESKAVLNDVPAATMQMVLNYIYSNRVPELDDPDLVDALLLADRLFVDGLKKILVAELMKHISVENVTVCLELGDKICADVLFDKAVAFFCRHKKDIEKTEGWIALRRNNPALLARVMEKGWDMKSHTAPFSKRRRTVYGAAADVVEPVVIE